MDWDDDRIAHYEYAYGSEDDSDSSADDVPSDSDDYIDILSSSDSDDAGSETHSQHAPPSPPAPILKKCRPFEPDSRLLSAKLNKDWKRFLRHLFDPVFDADDLRDEYITRRNTWVEYRQMAIYYLGNDHLRGLTSEVSTVAWPVVPRRG